MTPSETSYFIIPLTQGQFAKISNHRYVDLMKYRWAARWSKNAHGFYAVAHAPVVEGRRPTILMHRLIMGFTTGSFDGQMCVDHINGDTLDNRDENLRIADRAQNSHNRGMRKDNSSGYKGVSRTKSGLWRAQIQYRGEKITLGDFLHPENAYRLYCRVGRKLYGEFWREI